MPIVFHCPHCQQKYTVADANAGKRFACKACGNPAVVPASHTPAPAAASAPVRPAASPAGPREFAPWEGQPRPALRPAGSPPPPRPRPMIPGARPGGLMGGGTRGPNIVYLCGVGAMFLGFFLPWISIDLLFLKLSWGGYELPGVFNDLIDKAAAFTEPGDPEYEKVQSLKTRGVFLYSVYLIPLLTLGGFIEEITGFKKNRNWVWARAIAAASPVIAFVAVMLAFAGLGEATSTPPPSSAPASSPAPSGGPTLFDFLGIGIYLSFAGFVAAVVGIFVTPKPKQGGQPAMPHGYPAGPAAAMPRPAALPRPAAPGPRPRPPAGQRPALPGRPRLPRR